MRFWLLVLPLASLGGFSAPDEAVAVSLREYPQLQAFLDNMAARHDLPMPQLKKALERAKIRHDIIEAIQAPKERLPWYEYRKLFVTKQSASRGTRFWRANADALSKAYEQYGVDPAIIVAIIGVETQYGRNAGRFRVIDALATLMLEYPPRSKFFERQLEEYLLLIHELALDPTELRGSYAGAIGVPQFIPSSYRQYAVDFDGDGQRNIVKSISDAIGSVANFLKKHGWQRDTPVIERISLEGELAAWIDSLDVETIPTLRYLMSYGILPMHYSHIDQSAALIRLKHENGPIYYIGYNNFYVITRYNRSYNYAMAVYELSEWIRRLHNLN